MIMILFVLHDPEKLEDVLAAWQDAGVTRATVLWSAGLRSMSRDEGLRDDTPLIPSLEDFYPDADRMNRTIFAVLPDDNSLVDAVVAATESVVGPLEAPETGLLVVLPVLRAYGSKLDGDLNFLRQMP